MVQKGSPKRGRGLALGLSQISGPLTASFMLFSPLSLVAAASGLFIFCLHPHHHLTNFTLFSHSGLRAPLPLLLQGLFWHVGYFASRNADCRLSDFECTLLIDTSHPCNLQTFNLPILLGYQLPSDVSCLQPMVTHFGKTFDPLLPCLLSCSPWQLPTLGIFPEGNIMHPLNDLLKIAVPLPLPALCFTLNHVAAAHNCVWPPIWLECLSPLVW